MLTERLQAFEAQFHDEFPDRVRRALRTALLTDRTNSADIASLFSMTSRTMNRRLNAYGLSFQVLVDEGRYEIARQALIDTDINVSHVAALLGYDASSFVRAFQRWSGTSPSQWRSEQQAPVERAAPPERRTTVPDLFSVDGAAPLTGRPVGRLPSSTLTRRRTASGQCGRRCPWPHAPTELPRERQPTGLDRPVRRCAWVPLWSFRSSCAGWVPILARCWRKRAST